MLKTVTINLAGQVFHIDENAYEVLFAYLQKIKIYYKNEEGSDEILADIEARFAEIFLDRLHKKGKNVVSLPEVEEVVALMGNPEEFDAGATIENEHQKEDTKQNNFTNKDSEKRLYRNPDDKIVAGVCSGLANYLGINDPVWIRILFILAVVLGLSGILIYLILMIIVPEANTSAQKLQMKGEAVNLSNIEKTFRDGIKSVEDNINNISQKEGALYRIVELIGKAFALFFKVFFAIFKFLFTVIGGLILISAIMALGALAITGLAGIPLAADYITESYSEALLGGIGTFLLFIVPAIALIMLPFHWFSKNIRPFSRIVNISLVSVFLIGIVLTSLSVLNIGRNFSVTEKYTKQSLIADSKEMDTIFISSKGNGLNFDDLNIHIGWNNYEIEGDDLYFGAVKINIEESSDSNFYIIEEYFSTGKDKATALKNVRNISHEYTVKGNHFVIDNMALTKDGSKKWRNQKVEFTLQIPANTIVVFDEIEDYINYHPKIKSGWYADPSLESSAWRLKDNYLYPLDSNIVWTRDDDSDYSKIRIKKDFDEVEVNGLIDLEIIGSQDKRLLTNNASDINVVFENGVLYISNKNNVSFPDLARPVKVKLYINEINHISISGMTKAKVKNFANGPLDIKATGASIIIFDQMYLDDLDLKLSGQSTLKGKATIANARIDASGNAKIDAADINIDNLNIDLSGACLADVNVLETIKGNLSGASELEYRKSENLKIEDFSTNGTSRVIPKN